MKLVCIDKSTEDRRILKTCVENLFLDCRDSLGHLSSPAISTATANEFILNPNADAAIIGPGLQFEEMLTVADTIHRSLTSLPIIALLKSSDFTLSAVSRTHHFITEILSISEQPTRIVFSICKSITKARTHRQGSIVTVTGVKGGVGTSTLTAAFADVASFLSRRAIIFDLSEYNSLARYLLMSPQTSDAHGEALLTSSKLDPLAIKSSIVQSSSGIALFPAPTGGEMIRERWLRDPLCLETSLEIVDALKGAYSPLLVDLAHAEGILPFSLTAKANYHLIVTSNDPASVHLLSRSLSSLWSTPSSAKVSIVLNNTVFNGLTRDQVLDYLYAFDRRTIDLIPVYSIPFDAKGGQWIGSGNSLFEQSSQSTRHALVNLLSSMLDIPMGPATEEASSWRRIFDSLLTFGLKRYRNNETPDTEILGLPDHSTRSVRIPSPPRSEAVWSHQSRHLMPDNRGTLSPGTSTDSVSSNRFVRGNFPLKESEPLNQSQLTGTW